MYSLYCTFSIESNLFMYFTYPHSPIRSVISTPRHVSKELHVIRYWMSFNADNGCWYNICFVFYLISRDACFSSHLLVIFDALSTASISVNISDTGWWGTEAGWQLIGYFDKTVTKDQPHTNL